MRKKPVLTSSHLLKLATATKIDAFKPRDVEMIYVHFYLSDLDKLHIKMTSFMSWFQIWPYFYHTMKHKHVNNIYM